MSNHNPEMDDEAIAEAIKALLIKEETASAKKTDKVDNDMSFVTSVVWTSDEIRVASSQFPRQLRAEVTLKEKLSIMKEATQGLNVKMSKIYYEYLD